MDNLRSKKTRKTQDGAQCDSQKGKSCARNEKGNNSPFIDSKCGWRFAVFGFSRAGKNIMFRPAISLLHWVKIHHSKQVTLCWSVFLLLWSLSVVTRWILTMGKLLLLPPLPLRLWRTLNHWWGNHRVYLGLWETCHSLENIGQITSKKHLRFILRYALSKSVQLIIHLLGYKVTWWVFDGF